MKINGTLDLAGYNATVEGLSGRGLVASSVPGLVTLRVDTTGQSSTFSGVIEDGAGRLGLTTVGTGMLTLRGTNTFTGETTVEAGSTLRLWEFRTDSCQKWIDKFEKRVRAGKLSSPCLARIPIGRIDLKFLAIRERT